ncbi:MAG TPA: TIR domain-containing protein [Prosthecobacter sp.]|nr:TIR domain-containing protein [Prosthecobacter sp.]
MNRESNRIIAAACQAHCASLRLGDALRSWRRELQLERKENFDQIIKPLKNAYEDVKVQIMCASDLRAPEPWESLFEQLDPILLQLATHVIEPWRKGRSKSSKPGECAKLLKRWKATNPLQPAYDDLKLWDMALQKAWEGSAEKIVCECLPQRIPADKPHFFVASSSEGLLVAQAIIDEIKRQCPEWEFQLWSHPHVLPAGNSNLEAIAKEIARCHFGLYVMTGDDQVHIRHKLHATARANVICEYGIGVGKHGRHRSFIIHPKGGIVPISDLHGIITRDYQPPPPSPAPVKKKTVPAAKGKGKAAHVQHPPPDAAELTRLAGVLIADAKKQISESHEVWKQR